MKKVQTTTEMITKFAIYRSWWDGPAIPCGSLGSRLFKTREDAEAHLARTSFKKGKRRVVEVVAMFDPSMVDPDPREPVIN